MVRAYLNGQLVGSAAASSEWYSLHGLLTVSVCGTQTMLVQSLVALMTCLILTSEAVRLAVRCAHCFRILLPCELLPLVVMRLSIKLMQRVFRALYSYNLGAALCLLTCEAAQLTFWISVCNKHYCTSSSSLSSHTPSCCGGQRKRLVPSMGASRYLFTVLGMVVNLFHPQLKLLIPAWCSLGNQLTLPD